MATDFATIPDVIRRQCEAYPDNAALIEARAGWLTRGERAVTFRQLDAMSLGLAAWLVRRGVGRGDVVLVLAPMSSSLYVVLLALFRVGATAMILDPAAGLEHVRACCAEQPPRAFFGVWKAHALRLLVPEIRAAELSVWVSLDPSRLPCEAAPESGMPGPGPETAALLTFTSGSTGRPKAAVRTHGFLIAQHQALAKALELRAGEVDLTTLPVFVLANMASGVTSLLPDADMRRPGQVRADRIAAQVARHRPARTAGSPAFYLRILAEAGPEVLGSFRRLYTGGAPVFPSTLRRLQEAAPHAQVVAVYGSTEAEPVSHIPWDAMSSEDLELMRGGKGLLAGHPVQEIQLRIVDITRLAQSGCDEEAGAFPGRGPMRISDTDFQSMATATGEAGEIWVAGAHVLQGYLGGRGDAECKCVVSGAVGEGNAEGSGTVWHRTGDAGYLDTQGRLWLLGRVSACVRDDRATLYPFAVECVAMSFDCVRRCAFVAGRGVRILVVEHSRPPAAEESVALAEALAWVSPIRIVPVSAIPLDRRHNAKVDYPALRKYLASTGLD